MRLLTVTEYGVTQDEGGNGVEGHGFCVNFCGLSSLMLPLYNHPYDNF